jgi:hypothetical protein
MPVIPAWLVRSNLNDPRKIPYLLVWKDARGGEIMEAVRLARYVEPSNSRVTDNYVELKRTDGSFMILRIVWRMLPRNGGRALLLMCAYCNTPRRHVYGWEWDSVSVPFYNAFARWTNGLESNTSETLVPKVIRKHYAIAWSNAQRSQLTLQNQLVTRACG